MVIKRQVKNSFSVIGKEGSTLDGPGFIPKLWNAANAHFDEISHLVKRDGTGNLAGIWGAMSDLSRSWKPWEDNFSKGLYLAGFECADNACAPEGWTKWSVPGCEYLCAEVEDGNTFHAVLDYMNAHSLPLMGAVHEFTCPISGRNYLYFPLSRGL